MDDLALGLALKSKEGSAGNLTACYKPGSDREPRQQPLDGQAGHRARVVAGDLQSRKRIRHGQVGRRNVLELVLLTIYLQWKRTCELPEPALLTHNVGRMWTRKDQKTRRTVQAVFRWKKI